MSPHGTLLPWPRSSHWHVVSRSFGSGTRQAPRLTRGRKAQLRRSAIDVRTLRSGGRPRMQPRTNGRGLHSRPPTTVEEFSGPFHVPALRHVRRTQASSARRRPCSPGSIPGSLVTLTKGLRSSRASFWHEKLPKPSQGAASFRGASRANREYPEPGSPRYSRSAAAGSRVSRGRGCRRGQAS